MEYFKMQLKNSSVLLLPKTPHIISDSLESQFLCRECGETSLYLHSLEKQSHSLNVNFVTNELHSHHHDFFLTTEQEPELVNHGLDNIFQVGTHRLKLA